VLVIQIIINCTATGTKKCCGAETDSFLMLEPEPHQKAYQYIPVPVPIKEYFRILRMTHDTGRNALHSGRRKKITNI
jgi:hypothetical protein